MAMKEWFRRMQPVQLYLVLALSIAFVLTELVVSHITHAMTLLVDSYHMLCNIIALTGCIVTIKYGKENQTKYKNKTQIGNSTGDITAANGSSTSMGESLGNSGKKHSHQEPPTPLLKNTFGWARIDVIMMIVCFVFLASLCFSLLVEALQTLVHIDHHDEMHHPIPVLIVGTCGLLLNGICYLLIGGYTFHQGSFLHVTASGDVVLDRVVTKDSVKMGQRRLSRSRPNSMASQPEICNDVTRDKIVPATNAITTTSYARKYDMEEASPPVQEGIISTRQGAREMARDILGCVYVIICSVIVYYTDEQIAKFVDPIISIISAVHLLWLSYPYMKESGLILLQTMPDTINIDALKAELLEAFPDIINIHDFHVWQLTASKVISTAHIIFQDPKVYAKITKEVTDFFISQGITQVTVQPEFSNSTQRLSHLRNCEGPDGGDHQCLMRCLEPDCTSKHCCAHHMHKEEDTKVHKRWTSSKEIIPTNSIHDLKSIKIHPFEFPSIETQPSSQSTNAPPGPVSKLATGTNHSKSAQDISTNVQISKISSNYDSLYDIDNKIEVSYFEKKAPLLTSGVRTGVGAMEAGEQVCDKLEDEEEPLKMLQVHCDYDGDGPSKDCQVESVSL